MIDLASAQFWLVAIGAIVLLTPLVSSWPRHIVFALVNLTFVSLIWNSPLIVAWVLPGIGLFWLLLKRKGRLAVLLGLLFAGALFVSYKFSRVGVALPALAPVNAVLAALSFSYVFLRAIDVLRAVHGGLQPAPGFIALLNYLIPFHMLGAGPIQEYTEYAGQKQIPDPLRKKEVIYAIERIVRGLFKKFVVAWLLAQLISTRWEAGGGWFLLEVQLHYIWLYLDFSAYTDIAVGLGILLGFRAPENFRNPFGARNLTVFWERWHITLSMFIRRTIFLPMQVALQRRTRGKYVLFCSCASIFTAFLLCGAWHAFTVKYVLWGCLHGLGLMTCILYRAWLQKRLGTDGVKRYLARRWIRVVATIVTFEFVAFSVALIGDQWSPTW